MKWIGQHIVDLIAKFRNKVDFSDTVNFSEDVTFYQPVNNADPNISLGSSDDERLQILVNYQGTASQTAQQIIFKTLTESGTAHDGLMKFMVDEVEILRMQDNGIKLAAGMGIAINGASILTDSSGGTATLSNIDSLDSATIATFKTAMEANIDTLANLTSIGTIGTGAWRGDPIQTAYIGDDQVTEDKLANTLLAEIDANTAKVTNVTTNLTGTTSVDAYRVNSSDGTNVVIAEASGSIAGVMTVTHHDKLDGIEASATADQSKSDIDGLAITTVGTIDTGVWQGTAIAANQQKHLMHYQVQGFSAGNTNYLLSKNIGSNTAPFKHDVDIGSDGTTAKSVTVWMKTGGHVMPNACTLKRFTGWTETAGGGTAYVGLFRVRLSDDSDTDPSAVLLQEVTYTASGNQIANLFNVTDPSTGDSDDLELEAGDIIFPAIKGAGNPTYFNGTFEVEF